VPSSPDWDDLEEGILWARRAPIEERRRSGFLAGLRDEGCKLPAEVEETFVKFKMAPPLEYHGAFEKLLESDDPEVRISAALITWSSGPQSRFPILLEVLRGEYPTACKVTAIKAMGYLTPASAAEVLPTLCEVMQEDQDPDVLLAAARASSKLANDAAFFVLPSFQHLLGHPSPVVRSEACSVLGEFGEQAADSVPSLLALVKPAELPEVRREAARALARIDPEGNGLREELVEESQRELLLVELTNLRAEGWTLWVNLKAHWEDRTVPADISKHELETQGQEDEAGREVNLTAASHALAPPPSPKQRRPRAKFVRQIDRWSDLAIGIDDFGKKIYALTPCPAIGEEFVWENATPLELGDVQVTKILRVLALSKDGKTASKKELIEALGFASKAGIDLMAISEDQAKFDENMTIKLRNAVTVLHKNMPNIKRLLNVMFPTDDPKQVLVNSSDKEYVFAFVTRHLQGGPDGKLRFGEPG
jgi:HEAT repeat protein